MKGESHGRARKLAWALYAVRVESLLSEQRQKFMNGETAPWLRLQSPLDSEVTVIEAALHASAVCAQASVVSRALAPLVSAIDAIDNFKTKSPAVAEIRKALQSDYEELHALSSDVSVSAKEPA